MSVAQTATQVVVKSATTPKKRRKARGRQGERSEPTAAPLVHREQSFTLAANIRRRSRYKRRSQSCEWLIRVARKAAGKTPVAEDIVNWETGETRSVRAGDADWVRPPRAARCSWRLYEEVGIHAYEKGSGKAAHFSGTERCGSIWACPVCAAVIRAERATEISKAVESHQASGGSLLFVTLTLPHGRRDALNVTLDALIKCWQKLLSGKAWGVSRARYGIEGYIRSVEVTLGVNGWHPHAHAIIFLNKALSESDAQQFGDELHGRWARYVKNAVGKMPSRKHGVDVQRVDGDGKVIAQYLSKLQEEKRWDVGAEIARGDIKAGRSSSIAPFQLLDDEMGEDWLDDEARAELWGEYFEATHGRRAITWSRGLKDRFAVEELTDDEVIEKTETAPPLYAVYGAAYDRIRRDAPELLAKALELAEEHDWDALRVIMPGYLIEDGDPFRQTFDPGDDELLDWVPSTPTSP